jgi:hypothetical protein
LLPSSQYFVVYISISPPFVTTTVAVNVVIMNAESGDSQTARQVVPKGRKDPRSLRCFYCGVLGHIKAGCQVRIYRQGRAEKRAREGRYGDGKVEDTLPDMRAVSVARKHKWDEFFKAWKRSREEFEAAWNVLKADLNG